MSLRARVLIAAALVLAVVYFSLKAWRARSTSVPQIQAIAVLPLRNVSGDSSQQYLADGMTEELVSDLGQISALRVISNSAWISLLSNSRKTGAMSSAPPRGLASSSPDRRREAAPFALTNNNSPGIARQLGIDGVVNGSVTREGTQIRITAQLTDARTGRTLWNHDYVRSFSSALDLQREVAREIAEQIRVAVTPREQARLTATRSVNHEAQELYLQGRYFLNRGGDSSQIETIGYFEKAIAKDSSFGPAYAGLAASYNFRSQAGTVNYREAYSKAKTAAKKAIEIDDDLAEAHAALAYDLIDLDWDWTAAANEFRRALEINSNSAPVHSAYALHLARLGRSSEAISEAERGLQLDPISLLAYHVVAYCYYGARQYDRGLEQIRKASDLNLVSPSSWIHWTIGIIYSEKGSFEKAIEEFRIVGDQPHAIGYAGNAYARAGQLAEATQTIFKLKKYVQKQGVGAYEIALVYAGLGDKNEAFDWLEKSYKTHDKGLTYLKLDPCLDPLRSDPRFKSLLQRVGLPG